MTLHTLLLFAQLAAPASTPVAAPTLGYTVVNKQPYVIAGLPGAAVACPEAALTSIGLLISASHAPAAVVISNDAAPRAVLITPGLATPLDAPGVPRAVAISPSARYALLQTTEGLYRFVLQPTPDRVAIQVPASLSGDRRLDVSDLGSALVTNDGELYYWRDPETQPVHLAQPLASPRFAPRSNLIAALTACLSLVLLDPATGLTIQTLASDRDGLTSPVEIGFGNSDDLWVAQSSSAPALRLSLSTRAIEIAPLSLPAIKPLSPGVFLVDHSLHVLDTNRPTPTVLSVPTCPSVPTSH